MIKSGNDFPFHMRSKEAAEYLRLKPMTLVKLRCEGKGPPFVRVAHNHILYLHSDLDKYIADRRVESLRK